MDKITNQQLELLIGRAVDGDKKSLETVIMSVQDLIFNLSLRMLGTFADAEDASQDIIVKVIVQKRECFFYMGLQDSGKSFERLQKTYVCQQSSEPGVLRG